MESQTFVKLHDIETKTQNKIGGKSITFGGGDGKTTAIEHEQFVIYTQSKKLGSTKQGRKVDETEVTSTAIDLGTRIPICSPNHDLAGHPCAVLNGPCEQSTWPKRPQIFSPTRIEEEQGKRRPPTEVNRG